MTFQWYKDEYDGHFRVIPGATSSTFIPDTSVSGITHYRVVITNTNDATRITGNRTARTTSHIVTLIVEEPAPVLTPEQTGVEWINPFTDVNENDWFFEFVRFTHMNNLFSGTSATTFSPNAPMTRGMMVTVLYRMADTPDVSGLPNNFTDVAEFEWYANAVTWATANGIASGVSANHFSPRRDITREQMALMLYNYAQYMGLTLPVIRTGSFADEAQINTWARRAVTAMFEAGILNGRGGGFFDPQGNGTRAEVATMFRNFMEATQSGPFGTDNPAMINDEDLYFDRREEEETEPEMNDEDNN